MTGGLTTLGQKNQENQLTEVTWSHRTKNFINLKTAYGPPLTSWKYIMGVPEGKEKTATRFEKIVAENFPDLKKGVYKLKQLSELPSILNPKEPTDHIESQKQRASCKQQEKSDLEHKSDWIISGFLSRNLGSSIAEQK